MKRNKPTDKRIKFFKFSFSKKGRISIELNTKLITYALIISFLIIYHFDIPSYLFNVLNNITISFNPQTLIIASLGIVWLLFLSSYKTGHVLNYSLSRKAVSKTMIYLLILTFFVFYQFYFLNLDLLLVAATPYVYTPGTYNTTNIKVSVFQIDDLVIMRANVTNQGGNAIDKVILNLTDSNNAYKYQNQAMTNTGNICPGTATCNVWEKNYTLQVSDPKGVWKINVTANDTVNAKASNSTTFTVNVGNLTVNLTNPDPGVYTNSNPLKAYQYTTFNINATVTCRNGNCGNVYGTVRYNASSVYPDTAINTTVGATPFYITSETLVRPDEVSNSTTGGGVIEHSQEYGYDDGYNSTTDSVNFYAVTGGTARINYTYHLYPTPARIFVTTSNFADVEKYQGVQLYNFSSNTWYNWINWTYYETGWVTDSTLVNTSSGLMKSDGTVIVSAFFEGDLFGVFSFGDTYASYKHSGLSCAILNKDQSCQLNWTVNATGTIDSAYKVGVLFNSSYSSVAQNHTNNATIQIKGGRLEVNLTYPPSMTVDQNSTFNVNASITCKDANCGNVYGTVRYNASSANPDTAINSTEGATPLYIISSNNIRPISYSTSTSGDGTITGSPSDGYDDGYNDTSTYLTVYAFTSGSATVNYSYSLTSNLAILFATLRGSTSGTGEYVQLYNFTSNNWYDWLVEPSTITTIYSVPVNTTSGLIKSDGTLILRLNATTGSGPSVEFDDTYVNYISNLISCGSLSKDQTCQLNWTVNATGTIDSAYKVGVLFNSSYSSVAQNHTNNATIQIKGGRLEVNLTYPPSMTVDQNSTFNVNATVTCKDANCGTVYGTVRYNASSTNPDTSVNTTEGATPFYISTGGYRPISWTTTGTVDNPENATDLDYNDTSTETHITLTFAGDACTSHVNYTYDLPDGTGEATLFATSRISDSYGEHYIKIYNYTSNSWYTWLDRTQTSLTTNSTVINSTSGLINSNGGVKVQFCGGYSGPSHYVSDTYISLLGGATNNILSCGSLSKDQSCQLNWTVNATGSIGSAYKIGVLFNSSYSSVTQNHTDNVTIKIIECTEAYTIRWNTIDFGDLNPNTTNNNATGNNNQTYNISNTGTCNLKIWLKGTDLQNTTAREPSNVIHIIGVGNITWQNVTNNPSGAYELTKDYVILNSSFTQAIKNITTYYWLTVPPIPAGPYNGSITYCANTTQQSGLTGSC